MFRLWKPWTCIIFYVVFHISLVSGSKNSNQANVKHSYACINFWLSWETSIITHLLIVGIWTGLSESSAPGSTCISQHWERGHESWKLLSAGSCFSRPGDVTIQCFSDIYLDIWVFCNSGYQRAGTQAFFVAAPTVWNNLPHDAWLSVSQQTLRPELKCTLYSAVIFNRGSTEPKGSTSICQGFRGSSEKKIKIGLT